LHFLVPGLLLGASSPHPFLRWKARDHDNALPTKQGYLDRTATTTAFDTTVAYIHVSELMAGLSARLTAIAPAFGTARPCERCHAKFYERSNSDFTNPLQYLAISNLGQVRKGSNSRPRHYLSHARPFASLFDLRFASLRDDLPYSAGTGVGLFLI